MKTRWQSVSHWMCWPSFSILLSDLLLLYVVNIDSNLDIMERLCTFLLTPLVSCTSLLFWQVSRLPNEKESIYGALDKWTAWETEFPVIAAAKALEILRGRNQWLRIIQVCSFGFEVSCILLTCNDAAVEFAMITSKSNKFLIYLTNLWDLPWYLKAMKLYGTKCWEEILCLK